MTTLDRFFVGAMGWVRRRTNTLRLGRSAFLRRANAAEARFAQLSESELSQQAHQMRAELQLGELTDARVAAAFALIRVLSDRTLGMRHFDVQLIGGRILLNGQIAEMDTGEGKTLTATLPAATAALAGIPVHVVTVNDFLAARDAEWMRPLYNALGLSVGVILEEMSPDERRDAYACDICYCTNKQLAFDYLKDRLILDAETRPLHLRIEGLKTAQPSIDRVMMRGLCFAIVDEADSCLIDEARTPLVISRAGDLSDMEDTYRHAIGLGRKLQTPRDYLIAQAEKRVQLTDIGKAQVRRLSETWGGVWAAEVHREELARQALSALFLYELDKHYIVREQQVQIVDEYTGRIMGDRKWERGLHQMIEVKEEVEVTGRNETLARISYQRFFRRYLKLAGMTGTARELTSELWSVYNLMVTHVPTHRKSRRQGSGRAYFATEQQKWEAVAERVEAIHMTGQPVLIGTRSVGASEALSEQLSERGLTHNVLNARQDQNEAEIVAQAGQHGQITVATNMAGRGTDIRLTQAVRDLGGLYVFGTELHDSARIDRQLFGRCGRQGDPGRYQMYVSFEDDIVRDVFGQRIDDVAQAFSLRSGRVPAFLSWPFFWIAQTAAERRNSSLRRSLLRYDDNLEDLLAFTGRNE